MPLTHEEKLEKQRAYQKAYRAKNGSYTPVQKRAIYKYQQKLRERAKQATQDKVELIEPSEPSVV